MRKRSIPWTRLAALPLTLLLVVCGGVSAKANDKLAFSQSSMQGVSMTWTIENLYFDGRLLALDVLISPSDARYSACNDVLGDYADFTEADDARAEAPAKLPMRWVIWRWQAGTMRRSLPVFRAY